jgi:hypothetical protein
MFLFLMNFTKTSAPRLVLWLSFWFCCKNWMPRAVGRDLGMRRCSPALVTLIANGQRQLSPDRVPDFAKLLRLSGAEQNMLLLLSGGKEPQITMPAHKVLQKKSTLQRHGVRQGLFHPWFNLYLWEAARLPGFRTDAHELF